MNKGRWIAAASLLGLAGGCGPQTPDFSCYRNIYNTSAQPWTFQNAADDGNLYFTNCATPNGPCTVPAQTTTPIHYTTSGELRPAR
jgi:hypothetical protein